MDPTHPSPPPPSTTLHVTNTGVTPPPSPPQKLRLMISHNGHILPRPHTKTLFYSGGETRLISVPRTTALSLSSLLTHISNSLYGPHNNNLNSFTIKYQLPNVDLDSLISICSNEDLCNMIEEYDRVRISTTGRIRFFVFKDCGGCGGGDDWFGDVVKVMGSNPDNGGGGGEDGGSGSHESIVLESSSSFGSTNSLNSHGINNYNGNFKGGDDLKVVFPSFDSFGSDTSTPSPSFGQQTIIYQDASVNPDSKPNPINLLDIETNASNHTPRNDIPTPFQVSSYMVSKPPLEQPQHQSPPPPSPQTHYIHHPSPAPHSNFITQYYPNSIPIAYPPMYQTYIQPQQHFQYQINKPYPLYMIPVSQTHTLYDASSMHNLTTPSQPQVLSNPVLGTTLGPEYGAKVCGSTSVSTQPMNQLTQAQPVSGPAHKNTNDMNDYEDLMRAQIYKTQPSLPTLSDSQLQFA